MPDINANADRLAEIRAAAAEHDSLGRGIPSDDVLWLYEWLDRFAFALGYYADPMTYFAIAMIGDAPHGDFFDDFEEYPIPGNYSLMHKPGKRARQALRGEDPDA